MADFNPSGTLALQRHEGLFASGSGAVQLANETSEAHPTYIDREGENE